MFTIYLITNKVNGKVYIGQTNQPLRRRWGLHKSRASKNEGYTAHLYNAIRKYGLDNFSIKEIATCNTEEWSNYLERLYILIHDSMNPKTGYNMTSGGDRPSPSPESRERQRQKLLGRKATEDQKQKISDGLRLAYAEGRHPGVKGRKATEEQRNQQSLRVSGRGHWNFNSSLVPEQLVFLWNNGVNIKTMSEHFGVSVDTISRRIRATQLPLRERDKTTEFKKSINSKELQTLLDSNFSLVEIGKRLGTNRHTVSLRIKTLGLTRSQAA